MDAGTHHHDRKAAAELVAGGWITLGRFPACLDAGGILGENKDQPLQRPTEGNTA
jgi:hypothetical protein